jgi:hypothetical protein
MFIYCGYFVVIMKINLLICIRKMCTFPLYNTPNLTLESVANDRDSEEEYCKCNAIQKKSLKIPKG